MSGRSVLMVCRSIRGGMKQHLFHLIRGLSQNGIKVTVAGPVFAVFSASCPVFPSSLPPPLSSAPVEVIDIPIPENPLTLRGVTSIRRLARLIKIQHYDLVHTHGYVAGIIGRAAALAAGQRLLVHTVHNHFPSSFSPLILLGGKKIEAHLSRYTNRIIAVSEYLKNELMAIGIPADKVSTIYNGIEPSAASFDDRNRTRKSLGLPPHSFVVGTVARLIPAKGVDLMLKAVALVKKNNPHIKGIIVGDGPENTKLQNLAADLDLTGDILFLGHRDDVPALLPACDLFVLASRQEGFGISVLEAQYSGLPVVASRAGGIGEIINHGDNGLLFPPGDHYALADLLGQLIDNSDYRRALACAGQKNAIEKYSCAKMIESTLELYAQLFPTT